MSYGTIFHFGYVTSWILVAPDISIRPLWLSTTVKRPLIALSLTQILILTTSTASYTSLRRRRHHPSPVKFPLTTLRMPPIYCKVLETNLTDMSYCFSSNTCLKFIGSISTTEARVKEISPMESCTSGCVLLSWVDSCCPDLTTH